MAPDNTFARARCTLGGIMGTTLIEYKKIGRTDDDLYIVLINGSEIGQPCAKHIAERVVTWLLSAIGDLRAKL